MRTLRNAGLIATLILTLSACSGSQSRIPSAIVAIGPAEHSPGKIYTAVGKQMPDLG